MAATSHETLGPALHVAGSGRVLVAFAFVLARGTGVQAVFTEAVSPAVVIDRPASWDDVGARHGASGTRRSDNGRVGAGRGHNHGAVGAMKTSVLGGEDASAFLGRLGEVVLEVHHGPVGLRLVAPFLGGSGENAGCFEDTESEAQSSGVSDWLLRISGEALDLFDAVPEVLNWFLWVPGGG